MQTAPIKELSFATTEQPAMNKQSLVELQKAFSDFTSMSEQLSDSYHELEQRVVDLSGELASLSEQRLRELNEKEQIAEQLESLLRLMPAAVIVLDNKGIVRQVNPTAQQWLSAAIGEPEFQCLGQAWARIIRVAFAPKQTDYHEVSLRGGRLVSLDTSALDNAGQLIMMTDQTETRALQAKVSRQERLTAMGQMVASLAHQIRTPLSAAMLYASNLSSPRLTKDTHDQFVGKLVGRLNHLEKQVQDMLLFVKGEVQLIHRLSIGKIIELLQEATQGLPIAQQELLCWDICVKDAYVQCQSDALISAFMNVINNAIEASSEPAQQIEISTQAKGDQVEIVFKDNGPGMSADELKKIQEPFFTTKSYGTGLGVPVLFATVQAHNGHIQINSQPNLGTEFRVSLPVFLER